LLKVLVLSAMPEGLIRMFFAESTEKYHVDADFTTVNEPNPERLKKELWWNSGWTRRTCLP